MSPGQNAGLRLQTRKVCEDSGLPTVPSLAIGAHRARRILSLCVRASWWLLADLDRGMSGFDRALYRRILFNLGCRAYGVHSVRTAICMRITDCAVHTHKALNPTSSWSVHFHFADARAT